MSQAQPGANRFRGRLFKSAATPVLALSAFAGGVLLNAGDAKAVAVCNFDYYVNPAISCPPGSTATILDKKLTVVSGPSAGRGDVEFSKQLPNNPLGEWHVDVDFNPDFNNSLAGVGVFDYIIEVTDPNKAFNQIGLDGTYGLLGDNTSGVTKDIFTVAAGNTPGTLLATLTSTPTSSISSTTLPNFYQKLYIRDTATATATSKLIDTYQNSYTQKEVPAPLPILGAGAAFGAVGRMRKFSRQLKAFTTV